MGASPLRQFLQSLCLNYHWNYAVFWKLQRGNHKLLTWGDGCCYHPNLRNPRESIPDNACFNGPNGCSSDHAIAEVVANMEGVQYQWREGLIGEAAHTGNHCWVLCESISAGKFDSKLDPPYPEEWLLQFAAGIKTIVLVPIVPHGVLQLGALEKVVEDPVLVACFRNEFNAYKNVMDLFPFNSMEALAHTSSLPVPILVDHLDELSATTAQQMESQDPRTAYNVKPMNNEISTTNLVPPSCLVQDACYVAGKDILDILSCTRQNESCSQSIDSIKVCRSFNQSQNDTESVMMESSRVKFSCLGEELHASSYSGNCNVDIFAELDSLTVSSCSDKGMMEQPFQYKDADKRGDKSLNTFYSFPVDSELHKALGPAFLGQAKDHFWDSSLIVEDACNSSSQILTKGFLPGINSSTWESSKWIAKTNDAGHLSESAVATTHSCLKDNLSNKPDGLGLSVKSSGQCAAASKARHESEGSASVEEKRVAWGCGSTAFDTRGIKAVTKSPPASSFESMMSTLTEEPQQNKGYGCVQTRRESKPCNASKRGARHGENKRPRPRDRQLIQDRIKELRELVPNGSKCSIDGLLGNAIKHMLFLKSVTSRADKVRQWTHHEVTDKDNMKSSAIKSARQNGKSWAFELGGDLQVCPIVVKDLECPRQMLIEMLCSDHGLFLKIAEVIRGLELTILKGVMENRENNTWAHFIVEASRDMHRMEIVWPLMQQIQPQRLM